MSKKWSETWTEDCGPQLSVSRQIYSLRRSKKFKRAAEAGKAPPIDIFGSDYSHAISVDRMYIEDIQEMTEVCDAICKQSREQKAQDVLDQHCSPRGMAEAARFQGWAVISNCVLLMLGWGVKDTPLDKPVANDKHADIYVPAALCDKSACAESRWMAAVNELCAKLAGNCAWQKRHGAVPKE